MGENDMLKGNRDELTGLLDKPAFYEWGQDLIDDAPEDVQYAFIFFDLENFKQFNANYGFEKGDELLVKISNILREVFDKQLVSRFSGDHFVVCSEVIQIIPNILEIKNRVRLLQKNVNLEIKAGIYIYKGKIKDVVRCTDRARIACTSIKKKYDIDYRFYDDELGGHLARKQFIIDNLDEALENKYIQVYYQPIVRTITGHICGWEALVRWIGPKHGVVYPNEFISVLEEYRLIHRLDCYVVETVVSTFTEMEKNGVSAAVPVSINLSRIDFEVVNMCSYLQEITDKYQAPRELFRLEVTESAMTVNPEFIKEQIDTLRENGFHVWMDDFGSGYSSLNVLQNYQFDLVKIDMAFLREFDSTENGKIILKHMVSMLKNLGFHTLAEGVETEEQYDFLNNLGCELVQGYLIGRPMPIEDNISAMEKDGRVYEISAESAFYDRLGKVDILQQNPLRNIHNNDDVALPLAIGIVRDKKWRFIYFNNAYKSILNNYGQDWPTNIEKMINDRAPHLTEVDMFWDLCEQSKKSGNPESIEFVEDGKIINMRIRHISEDKDYNVDAYMLSIRILNHYLNSSYEDRVNSIGQYVLSLYECVDLFGVKNDIFENIYLNNSKLHVNDLYKSSKQIISDIAELRVHIGDQEAFKTFMDTDTIEQRISTSKSKILQGFFRIKNLNDVYVIKRITLKLVDMNGQPSMLSCVEEVDDNISAKLDFSVKQDNQAFGTHTDAYAFSNILSLLPVGVFWKDKERRFVGANQMFLDYYGLPSVDAIRGKTDEDMGWHINPEPFKRDELRVINNGDSIHDVRGECIVKGNVRNIMASKRPFIIDGKIVGLIGFFKDVTEDLQRNDDLEKLAHTDSLTGLINRRGYDAILPRYEKQYKTEGTDFALIIIDIDKFKQLNDIYGHAFGDAVLKAVSNKLMSVAGDSSIVARTGGDEFVILHQLKSSSDVDSIIQEININIAKIEEIEGEKIKITISLGSATYSRTLSLKKLYETADKKMYENKKQHNLITKETE